MNEDIRFGLLTNASRNYQLNIDSSFEDIKSVKDNFFKYLDSIKPYKNFLLVLKQDLDQDYKDNFLNYLFFDAVSNILVSYEFNKIGDNDVYKKLINIADDIKNDAGKIKQFIIDLRYEKMVENVVYLKDEFVEVKTLHGSVNSEYKNILHEAYVGMAHVNKSKYYIPNFSYTFCYSECSEIFMENGDNKILTWCNIPKENENLRPYSFRENVNGIPLSIYIKDCSGEEATILFLQYLNAYNFAKFLFKKYENRGVSISNLIVVDAGSLVNIPVYDESNPFNSSIYIQSNLILYITNFEDSTIGVSSNVVTNNPDYEPKLLLRDIIKIRNQKLDLNYVFKQGKVVNHKPFNFKSLLKDYTSDLCGNRNGTSNMESYITNFLGMSNKKFKKINDVVYAADEFIQFLMKISSVKCLNYSKYLKLISHRKNNIFLNMDRMSMKRKHEILYETLKNTIRLNYERLPSKSLLSKIMSYIPNNEVYGYLNFFSTSCILIHSYINSVLPPEMFDFHLYIKTIEDYVISKSEERKEDFNTILYRLIKEKNDSQSKIINMNTKNYGGELSLFDKLNGFNSLRDENAVMQYNIYAWTSEILKDYPTQGDFDFKELTGDKNANKEEIMVDIIRNNLDFFKIDDAEFKDRIYATRLTDLFRKNVLEFSNYKDQYASGYFNIISSYIKNILNLTMSEYVSKIYKESRRYLIFIFATIFWMFYKTTVYGTDKFWNIAQQIYFKVIKRIFPNNEDVNDTATEILEKLDKDVPYVPDIVDVKVNVDDAEEFMEIVKIYDNFDTRRTIEILDKFNIFNALSEQEINDESANKLVDDVLNIIESKSEEIEMQ